MNLFCITFKLDNRQSRIIPSESKTTICQLNILVSRKKSAKIFITVFYFNNSVTNALTKNLVYKYVKKLINRLC